MGLLATTRRASRWAQDPEALIVFTLEVARDDPRLFDELLDWWVANESLLSTRRLRALCRDPEDERLVDAAFGWVAQHRPRARHHRFEPWGERDARAALPRHDDAPRRARIPCSPRPDGSGRSSCQAARPSGLICALRSTSRSVSVSCSASARVPRSSASCSRSMPRQCALASSPSRPASPSETSTRRSPLCTRRARSGDGRSATSSGMRSTAKRGRACSSSRSMPVERPWPQLLGGLGRCCAGCHILISTTFRTICERAVRATCSSRYDTTSNTPESASVHRWPAAHGATSSGSWRTRSRASASLRAPPRARRQPAKR